MAQNRGKQFEQVIREAFQQVPGVSIDRLHDQMGGYKGSQNICDFIVYKKPYEYYFECKSVKGNTLPFRNITDTQWDGLLEKSKIQGVAAGVICWWIEKDVTLFIPIQELELEKQHGQKSTRYDIEQGNGVVELTGKKKRVFFTYNMEALLNEISNQRSSKH